MPSFLPTPPSSSKRFSLTIVAVIGLVGVLLSVRIYRHGEQSEALRMESEFNRQAEVQYALTRENIFYYESGVYALKSLFDGSDFVSRQDFRRVAKDVLGRYPGISALEWVPAVTQAERAQFEAQTSLELERPFQFTERAADGSMVRAAEREWHYPILFIEPLSGNEVALGYDLQSAPTLIYLHRARETQRMVVSSQFQLVQNRLGVVVVWPIHASTSGNPTPTFRGFVQGVFRVQEMFRTTKLHSSGDATEVLYIDDTATNPTERIMYHQGFSTPIELSSAELEAAFRSELHREYVLEFGSRRWVVLYRPTAAWLASQISPLPSIRLSVGLLVTALVAGLVGAMSRRTSAVQQQVAERTAELSESRRHLSSLLHALPGMAYRCSYNENLEAVYLSEGALELTGYRPEAFISGQLHFRDLIHPDDLERVRAATRGGLKSHDDVEVEYRIRPQGAGEKWILSRGRGIYDDRGKLLFFEGLAIDITARKQAEADKIAIERKLLESQKLESLGLLAGGIAHDFNNLLTGILGHANLARFYPGVDAEITDHLSKIESGAARAAELCQQMLAYSGRSNFIVEAVDLNQLIRDTLPLLQGSVSSRARLELILDVQPMVVMADATQLRQIIMNLILNAADALGAAGGEISVSTGRRDVGRDFLAAARGADTISPGEYIFLEVRDNGCGMTRDTISRIFDPFFTTKFTGRGLGLAAVLGIVRGHSGALRVQSEVNHGSAFTLILPPSSQALSERENLDTPSPWRSTGKVLVIDDEETVRNVAAALLETFGFFVRTASNGTDGIEYFRDNAFDLVLLDLTMPGMNGEETLAGLRAISPDVRVLLISGYSESDRIAQLAASGPLLFLQKPFTRSSLEQKLQEILELRIGKL